MADNHSFDITSTVNIQEVLNAVNQSLKEIKQRFDLKNTKSEIELNQKEYLITVCSDDEYKLKSVVEVLKTKMVKRSVPSRALQFGEIQEAPGGSARQEINLQNGIPKEKAKDIVKDIKATKIKVQAQIQEDQVRVIGKKLDDLQEVMKIVKEKDYGIHIECGNYR